MKNFLFALLAIMPLFVSAQGVKAVRPLFDKKSIGEIRLTLPAKNWVDALDSMRIYGMGMMTGSVSVDGVRYEGVGVRFRGDKSYQLGLKRNPFTIRLNHTDGTQNHQGYTSIKLSSALRDPSLVREVLFYEIAGKYMPASQACYTKLYVNDEYVGVFVNVESIDKEFLQKPSVRTETRSSRRAWIINRKCRPPASKTYSARWNTKTTSNVTKETSK